MRSHSFTAADRRRSAVPGRRLHLGALIVACALSSLAVGPCTDKKIGSLDPLDGATDAGAPTDAAADDASSNPMDATPPPVDVVIRGDR